MRVRGVEGRRRGIADSPSRLAPSDMEHKLRVRSRVHGHFATQRLGPLREYRI